jgi:hypothetical protein
MSVVNRPTESNVSPSYRFFRFRSNNVLGRNDDDIPIASRKEGEIVRRCYKKVDRGLESAAVKRNASLQMQVQ